MVYRTVLVFLPDDQDIEGAVARALAPFKESEDGSPSPVGWWDFYEFDYLRNGDGYLVAQCGSSWVPPKQYLCVRGGALVLRAREVDWTQSWIPATVIDLNGNWFAPAGDVFRATAEEIAAFKKVFVERFVRDVPKETLVAVVRCHR